MPNSARRHLYGSAIFFADKLVSLRAEQAWATWPGRLACTVALKALAPHRLPYKPRDPDKVAGGHPVQFDLWESLSCTLRALPFSVHIRDEEADART